MLKFPKILFDKHNILIFCTLCVFGVGAYSNTLEVPFSFDDVDNIVDNHHLQLKNLSFKNIITAAFSGPNPHRPVANLTFGLNYYFHRYEVQGYHIVNIIIHLLTSLLLFHFIRKTLELSANGKTEKVTRQIAFFTTLLWLVHPIQTQSVTYIVQRMTSLSALFFISSFLFYIHGRLLKQDRLSWIFYGFSMIAGFLAVGTKQNAVILPLMILVYEFYFFQDLKMDWARKKAPFVIGALALMIVSAFVFLGSHPFKSILDGYAQRDFTLTERLLTQPRVIFHYISLLLYPYPSRLLLDYDFVVSMGILNPMTTLFSFAGIFSLVVSAFFLAQKERLFSFCIIWFLGNLVIESSIIPLELVYEHRLYLPSMFFFLPFILLCYRYIKRPFVVTGLILLALIMSYWTFERNNAWRYPLTFWQHNVEKSPNKARTRTQYGLELSKAGRVSGAIKQYYIALGLNPHYIKAHNNLGNALQSQGRLREAAYHFEQYLAYEPDNQKALNNLSATYARMGNVKKAEQYSNKILYLNPLNSDAHNNMGNILFLQKRYREAIKHYRICLEIDPQNKNAQYNLQKAMLKINKYAK